MMGELIISGFVFRGWKFTLFYKYTKEPVYPQDGLIVGLLSSKHI